MKVYIVNKNIPYEGSEIIEVYKDEVTAAKVLAALAKTSHGGYYTFTVDEYEVIE